MQTMIKIADKSKEDKLPNVFENPIIKVLPHKVLRAMTKNKVVKVAKYSLVNLEVGSKVLIRPHMIKKTVNTLTYLNSVVILGNPY